METLGCPRGHKHPETADRLRKPVLVTGLQPR
jgi:hypothetical protein